MAEKATYISTGELWAKMFKSPNLESWLAEATSMGELPSFDNYITTLAKAKGKKKPKYSKKQTWSLPPDITNSTAEITLPGTRYCSLLSVLN